MKAIQFKRYGGPEVLQLVEVETPQAKDNELVIRVKASSVTRADTMMRQGRPYIGRLMLGLFRPKYRFCGTGFGGEVVAIGRQVTLFNVGDQVFGESIFGSGTNAEYLCVPEDAVLQTMPDKLSAVEACCICDGPLTSLSFLRDVGKLQSGQTLLIIGASGSLGSAAVQLGKYLGAQVTAVCSGANKALVKSLGADHVIDYTVDDFRKNGQHYDVIFDTVGKSSFCESRNSLGDTGVYLTPVFNIANLLAMVWSAKLSAKKAKFAATGMRDKKQLRTMITELKQLYEIGALKTVIDRKYDMHLIAEAHEYIEKGHKKGNVIIEA